MARIKLSVPQVLSEQKKWDDKYLGQVIHSIEVSRNNDHEEKERLVSQFLGRESIGEFSATNPYSKNVHLTALMERLLETWNRKFHGRASLKSDQVSGTVFAFLTFTDAQWATCDQNIRFDLPGAKKKIRNALMEIDYVGRFEPAVFVNEPYEHFGVDGKLVLFHAHVLAWASSLSMLARAREGIKHRFTPPAHSKSSVHMKRADLESAPEYLGYMSKMPTLGYRMVKVGEVRRQRKARMRDAQRRRLFMYMSEKSIFDFWFASGEGREPLRDARRQIVKRYPRGVPVTKIKNGKPVVALWHVGRRGSF